MEQLKTNLWIIYYIVTDKTQCIENDILTLYPYFKSEFRYNKCNCGCRFIYPGWEDETCPHCGKMTSNIHVYRYKKCDCGKEFMYISIPGDRKPHDRKCPNCE